MIVVSTKYTFQGSFSFDHIAEQAAGRQSDFSGSGFGVRDLGWVCKSEIEARRIKRALDKVGLGATISPADQKTTDNSTPRNA